MKLSNQALGAIMMALQKSLLEQVDIVPVLQEFQFQIGENELLVVQNPPNFMILNEDNIEEKSLNTNLEKQKTSADAVGSD